MALFSALPQDVLVLPDLTQVELDIIANSLQKDLQCFDDSGKITPVSTDELEKLILLLKRFPDLLKASTLYHETVCNATIDILNAVLECSNMALNDILFQRLASASGSIVLDILRRQKFNCSHFARRLAETFSNLMASICNRITSKKRFLQHVHFVLASETSFLDLGRFLGVCESFLVQANLVEALVKLTQTLLHFKLVTESKLLVSDICYGILDFHACKTNQIMNLSSLFMSIVRDVEINPHTTVHRIRSWLNIANDGRAKFYNLTIASFLSKKVLLQNKDMRCTAWVDFNLNDMTITRCESDDQFDRSDPVALGLTYTSITDVIGNKNSSSISIHVAEVEDLWENSMKFVNPIVFELARSDFSLVLKQFEKRAVKTRLSEKRITPRGALQKAKLPKEILTPYRKASITFSTDILEKFLNTRYSFTYADSVNPSGGAPIPQEAFPQETSQPSKKIKKARDSSGDLNLDLNKKLDTDTEKLQMLQSENMCKKAIDSSGDLNLEFQEKLDRSTEKLQMFQSVHMCQEWEKHASEFHKQFLHIQKNFVEATAELIQAFLESSQKMLHTV